MKNQLLAVLFRGLRFVPGKVLRKDTTCFSCRGRMKKGVPSYTAKGMKVRNLHPLCAEAIALDGNECVRDPETVDG